MKRPDSGMHLFVVTKNHAEPGIGHNLLLRTGSPVLPPQYQRIQIACYPAKRNVASFLKTSDVLAVGRSERPLVHLLVLLGRACGA